jgi:hypothetical protein
MPKRLWNGFKDGWKTSHKRSNKECSPSFPQPSHIYIYEKVALKINDLKKNLCQGEASIELLISLYIGHIFELQA